MKKIGKIICLLLACLLFPWVSSLHAEAYWTLPHSCQCNAPRKEVEVYGPVCQPQSIVKMCSKCNLLYGSFNGGARHTTFSTVRFAEDGTLTYGEFCKVCRQMVEENAAIPASKAMTEGGFIYDIYDTPVCAVVTGWTGEEKELTIPATLGGYPVFAIGPGAFAGCELKTLTASEGLVTVGTGAFADCQALVRMELPSTVTSIYTEAFARCSALSQFRYPKGWLMAQEDIFLGTPNLNQVDIPSGVEVIPDYAFYGAQDLTGITLPSGLKEIGDGAFLGTALTEIQFPRGMERIGEGAFAQTNLVSVQVPEGVKQVDRYAFGDCKKLADISFPTTIRRISGGMFNGCISLTQFIIPHGVIRINDNAFNGCYNLKYLVIPDSVVWVEETGTTGLDVLTDVFYRGSQSQWEKVWITEPSLMLLENATFHWNVCSHGKWTFGNDETHQYVCSKNCGTWVTMEHIWDYPEVVCEPEPGTVGLMHYPCVICGHVREEEIPTPDSTGPAVSSNIDAHRYQEGHSDVVRSALQPLEDGYLRIEAMEDSVVVEKYDLEMKYVFSKKLELELPLFGGISLGQNHNYLLLGKDYPGTEEWLRVVLYSKEWTRLGCQSIFGEKDIDHVVPMEPFSMAGLDTAQLGDYLFTVTTVSGQNTYTDTIGQDLRLSRVYMPDMYSDYSMWDYSYQYSTVYKDLHLAADSLSLVMTELSDAGPGNVKFTKYSVKDNEVDYSTPATLVELTAVGMEPYSVTTLGNLVATDSSYLTTGVSGGALFLAAVDRTNFSQEGTAISWLEGTEILPDAPPYLVEAGDNYALLWSTETGIAWCFVTDTGDVNSPIYCAEGALSDCMPVYNRGKLLWYVTDHSTPCFYSIDTSKPDKLMLYCNHSFRDGFCEICGMEAPASMPGDVDGDGQVTYLDAMEVLRAAVGLTELENRAIGDVDGDTEITYLDAMQILMMAVGLA